MFACHSIFSRLSATLCLLFLISAPRPAFADDGSDFVPARQQYAAALTEYLATQLALEQHALQGLDRLRTFGHASSRECDIQRSSVRRLESRLAAGRRFGDFLNELGEATRNAAAPAPESPQPDRMIVINPAILANASVGASPLVLLTANGEIQEAQNEIVAAERRQRDAELSAIEARKTLLSERLTLLRKLDSPWHGETAQIQHLELVLAASRAEQRVVQSRPSAVCGIDDSADVVRLVDQQWHTCLLQAEKETVAFEQEVLRTFADRLQAVEAAGATRPGELHDLTAKLRATDQRYAQLQSQLAALETSGWSTHMAFRLHDAGTAGLLIAQQRHRHSDRMARRLIALAQDDDFFAAESRWWTQISRIHTADLDAARARHSVQEALAALYSADEDNDLVQTSATVAGVSKNTQTLNRLKALLNASDSEASIRRARQQRTLAEQRLDALTTLQQEGHASPNEVANARMLVAVATAELSGVIADNDLNRASVRLLDALIDGRHETQVTLR